MHVATVCRWLSTLILCAGFGAGCASQEQPPPPPDLAPISPLVDRPFEVQVPPGYDKSKPTPLVLLLHGYSFNGAYEDKSFGLSKTASAKGFLYAFPDGTQDELKLRFWNATDGCCNMYDSQVDDVAYLRAVIKDIKSRYNVDGKRVFLVGHSNGGFMSYRLACEAADEIAGIVSLAGATWLAHDRCKPSEKVAVLQIHGDMDTVIKYDGGRFADGLEQYPAARDTVAQWAQYNGCSGMLMDSGMPPIDIDNGTAGSETKQENYACTGTAVELWTMRGGGHFPELPPSFGDRIYQFLMDHAKP